MAKTKISEFSATPANNTDIDGINIAENCPPSGINDAIRELMAQLKDWQSGTSNDPYVIGSSGSLTLNQGTANGVLYLNGSKVATSGSALTFDGATLGLTSSAVTSASVNSTNANGSAFIFKNSGTSVGWVGNGSSSFVGASASDFGINGQTNLIFGASGYEGMRLTSTGLGIGTSSPSTNLTIGSGGGGNSLGVLLSRGAASNFFEAYDGTKGFIGGVDNTQSFAKVGTITSHPVRLISANGSGYAHLDTSGNLGLQTTPSGWAAFTAFDIGTTGAVTSFSSSADVQLDANCYYNGSWRYKTTDTAGRFRVAGNVFEWHNAPSGTAGNAITFTQAMTLDASGNLLLGTTSSSSQSGTFGQSIRGSSPGITLIGTESSARIYSVFESGGSLSFFDGTAGAERASIDSSGNLLVGTTSTPNASIIVSGGDVRTFTSRNTGSSPYGIYVQYSTASPNGTSNEFLLCSDSTATRTSIRSNGGIANYQANDVNLSDRREKTNFSPAKSYLDVICAIPVQTFNYIDQNLEEDAGLTLGVVAQDVQTVAPELIMESNWGTEEEPKMRLSIYQTDLQYALMKALQELKAEFDAYKASHP